MRPFFGHFLCGETKKVTCAAGTGESYAANNVPLRYGWVAIALLNSHGRRPLIRNVGKGLPTYKAVLTLPRQLLPALP